MGEWSDYFEDFPEEAPLPSSTAETSNEKYNNAVKEMNADAFALIEKYKNTTTELKQPKFNKILEYIEQCPQCGENKLNVYKLENGTYLCECQSCGIYGAGKDVSSALHKTASAYGDGIDWRNDY